MNGFTEHRESGASEQPGDSDKVMTWDAGFAMLPLVERIATDIVNNHKRLKDLQPELQQLDANDANSTGRAGRAATSFKRPLAVWKRN